MGLGHACGVRVHRVQRVQKVQRERFLGLTGLTAGRFLSLTGPLAPRVADCRSAAMLIKSALRIYLSASYSKISTTVISHLRWLSPLWCLTAPPSPRGIGRATKGKRLYGQARRLTSPDLHILCRMCTVDNKALKSNPFISSSQHSGAL